MRRAAEGLAALVLGLLLLFSVTPGGAATASDASTGLKGWVLRSTISGGEPVPPDITATAAILLNADTGEILYSRNANQRLAIASTTKIMTAVIALETLKLDQQITISANAVSTIGSVASLQQGEKLTVEQVLYAMLVVSGNDAARALAETCSGSVGTFVQKMNQKAQDLGLTNTHYMNANGLNAQGHYSSAKDLATLARYALKNPEFAKIVNTVYFSLSPISKDQKRDFDNQNELLKRLDWVTGVKTGSTPDSGYCLVSSGTIEGVSLVAVVLGAKDTETRWDESESLLEYGFSLYPRTVLSTKGQFVGDIDISDYLGRRLPLVADGSLVMRLPKDTQIVCQPNIERPTQLPVEVGEVFGTLDFSIDGKPVGSVNLVASQAMVRPSIRMLMYRWTEEGPSALTLAWLTR